MKKLIYTWPLILLVSANVLAREKFSWENIKGTMDLSTNGTAVRSETNEVTKMGQSIGLGTKYQIANDINGSFQGGFSYEAGSSISQFNDGWKPRQTLYMSEAKADWTPKSWFNVEGGAVNMGYLRFPQFISGVAFLGVKESLEFEPIKYVQLKFSSVQAIPNNHMLAQRLGNVSQEGTPTFLLDKVDLVLGKKDSFSANLFAGQFMYDNLSAPVAYSSRAFGNSIRMGNESNSAFLYRFQGYISGVALHYDTRKAYSFNAEYRYLQNRRAPNGRNAGFIGRVSAKRYFSSFELELVAEQFRNESDTTPAFYNSMAYGNNNVFGTRTMVNFNMPNKNLSINLGYTASRVIPDTRWYAYQADTDIFTIGFSKAYDL